ADWSLELGYSLRRPAFSNMLSVMAVLELPVAKERRQDRDVASRLAELERARAEREDARRTLQAEIRAALADFDTAAVRIERSRRLLLPLARQRHEAALAAYRGGSGSLAGVLEAERARTEAELALVEVEAERARAWAELSFLYPPEAVQ
ncbi:MAG: TolC family protein, partial [Burkholderiales bacterium]